MLNNITKLNIAEHIKNAKKKNRKHINAKSVDKDIRETYNCIDIDYGSVQIVKVMYNELSKEKSNGVSD